MESVLDQELQPNFRPKHPCTCPKVARMSDNQFTQNTKLKMAKEMDRDNIPVTERTMGTQDPKQSRPQSQIGKYPQTRVTLKMEKMTRLELNHLTCRTHNPVLLLPPILVMQLH